MLAQRRPARQALRRCHSRRASLPDGRPSTSHCGRCHTFRTGCRQAVIDECRQFRMDRRQVIALVEIVADDLPVEVAVCRNLEHSHPVFQPIALETFRVRARAIHAAARHRRPCTTTRTAPMCRSAIPPASPCRRGSALKIVGVLHMRQSAIQVELPAMISAGDARHARRIAQQSAGCRDAGRYCRTP